MWSLIPKVLKSFCHREPVKILSLSVTITLGRPCSLKILSENFLATYCIVIGCFMERKWAYLVKLSTTTKIKFLFSDTDNPSTKSMLMWHQAKSGIGRGCSSPW